MRIDVICMNVVCVVELLLDLRRSEIYGADDKRKGCHSHPSGFPIHGILLQKDRLAEPAALQGALGSL
jgi:hypothetical protein